MTGVLQDLQFGHWLMVAGALLVAVGLVGLVGIAFDQRKNPEVNATEIATENERGQSQFQADLARIRADRKVKLDEQTKGRWASNDRGTKAEPFDNPLPPSGKEG
jgi:hypothetical protein